MKSFIVKHRGGPLDGELRDFAMRHGHIALEEAAADAAAAIDLPEPEPTAKAEEEPDYTCPICGENTLDPNGRCQCGVWSSLAAANRRIKELELERDEMEKLASLWNDKFTKACARADSAYAKGAEDFRESVAKALHDELGTTSHWAIQTVRTHPIPKPKENAGMREEALCVRQIVKKYLKDNGYDGLWCDECACVTDDIAPCGHIGEDCEAGYKRLVPPDESCGCCGQGCEHWHIEPKETQEETP